MKKAIFISLIFVFLFSCEKIDLCDSPECNKYIEIWEDLFISRNQLTQEYFDKHIRPIFSAIDTWNDGKSFRVEYRVKIDWAEADLADQFIIWIDPSTEGIYPSLQLPRSTWLSKTQISSALGIFAFGSQMYNVAMVEHLRYSSRDEARRLLEDASGVNNLEDGEIYYESPSFNECQGHPFYRIRDEINRSENECISCILNLVTGDTDIHNVPCVIYYY